MFSISNFALRVSRLKNGLLSLFFPTICPVCKRYIKDFTYLYVCPECFGKVKAGNAYTCPVCDKPLSSPHAGTCRECREIKKKFSYVRSAGRYEGMLKELIHCLKFYGKKPASKIIAEIILKRVDGQVFENIDCLVPVPLSRKAKSQRGYNQTELIAGIISSRKGIELGRDMVKVRETLPQNKLDRKQRLRNLRGAFEVKGDIRGKRALILDDVYTTGATMNEAAKTLLNAGAIEVRGIVAARSG